MTLSEQVANYLKQFKQVSEIKPISLNIKGVVYHGARYIETLEHNGKPYVQEKVYLVGDRPKVHVRSSRTAFKLPAFAEGWNDNRDYYIAAFMPKERLSAQFAKFHPFGANFLLMPWSVPSGETIDHYDILSGKKPYTRIQATKA